MQLHTGFWIINLLTSVLSNLFNLESRMDLSYFAGGRCTTLSRSSMVGILKKLKILN